MKSVAIVGFASSSRALANDLPDDVEIWGENQLFRPGFLKRANRWFELHTRTLYETPLDLRRPANYAKWLSDFPGPVYLTEARPDIPNSVRYPIEAVAADVGNYFTSTIAYMLGLAIHEKFTTIHLYGVDMAEKAEYAQQRACCEYLIGVARGRGIEVILPTTSPLLTGPLYGRGDLNPGGERITDSQYAKRLEELRGMEAKIERDLAAKRDELHIIKGAILETEYWVNVTPEGGPQQAIQKPAEAPNTIMFGGQTYDISALNDPLTITNGKTAALSVKEDQHG